MKTLILSALTFCLAMPAMAEGFQTVTDRKTFVSLISGKDLRRTGITLQVTPDGRIKGRGLGRSVSGAWQWKGGFFCRDLYWGKQNLGANCQRVQVQGRTLRFTSDRGRGEYADLTLQ